MLRQLRGYQCRMLVPVFGDFRLRCRLLVKFVRFSVLCFSVVRLCVYCDVGVFVISGQKLVRC